MGGVDQDEGEESGGVQHERRFVLGLRVFQLYVLKERVLSSIGLPASLDCAFMLSLDVLGTSSGPLLLFLLDLTLLSLKRLIHKVHDNFFLLQSCRELNRNHGVLIS